MNVRGAVRIVLVRPRNPLNIAASARAAKNFGFHDFAVVAPHGPVWSEAITKAPNWLQQARVFDSLGDAIGDCNWVIGTSSLSRRKVAEKSTVLSLEGLAARLRKERRRDRIALVFGSEKRGLSNDDLARCHNILQIPTSRKCPSMNLGQAVAVCCYEMRRLRASMTAPDTTSAPYASLGEIERLIAEVASLLQEGSPLPPGRTAKRRLRLSRALMHLPLTSGDISLILGVIRDLRRPQPR
jgi:tRNA/rRNA methyltransferase